MKLVTLVYCLKEDSILLGFKKDNSFGTGKLNGFGGKVKPGEIVTTAAARELLEEARISCQPSDLEKVAEMEFYFPDVPKNKNWNQQMHVYFLRTWQGHPQETKEMRPEWHKLDSIPYDQMWIDDGYWLPLILQGQKVQATFTFRGEGESITSYQVNQVNKF